MNTLRVRKLFLLIGLSLMFLIGSLWTGGLNLSVSAYDWIEISDTAGLNNIRNNLSGHYRLTADLNLSGVSWVPIGSAAQPFTGVLDGNSKVISNIIVNDTVSPNQGLFSEIGASGEIRNLGIEGANITTGDYSGILAGTNNGRITGCSAKGSITGKNYTGGLVGSNKGVIENCYASAFVSGNDYFGGLAGANSGTLIDSYSSSEVASSLFNNYLKFDGSDDYISIPHIAAYETDKFTLEAWFQWNPVNIDGDSSDVQFITGKGFEMFEIHLEGNSGSNGMRFIPIPNLTSDSWLDARNSVQSGWFHVAAVYDYTNGTARMYINGKAQDLWQKGVNVGPTASLPRGANPLAENDIDFNIGRRFDGATGSMYFDGKISDVRFWNKARTAEEIAADKNRSLVGNEPGLIGYWKLTEADGATALDSSVNNNSGILNGDILRVKELTASHKGGLTGDNTGTVTDSFYDSDKSSQSDTGKGEPRTTLQMKDGTTFAAWNFSSAWGINPAINSGYPYLLTHYAPTGSISINGGAVATDNRSVVISLPASDLDGSVTDMCFSVDGISWSDWETYAASKSTLLPSGNGTKTVFVKFRDNSGTESFTYSDSIELILPNIETSAGTILYDGSSPVLVDPGLTLSANTLDGCRVMIENLYPGDVLSFTGALPGGITASWNASAGILTFSGSEAVSEYQALLRTVTFRTTSNNTTPRNITFSLGKAVPSSNGHYYEFVPNGVSWTNAYTNASTRYYFGMQGYLATITSFTENDLIRQRLQADAWIGSSDDYRYINDAAKATVYVNQTASEGRWYWVTGPEAGQHFSTGNGSPIVESGMYMNWNGAEPNNSGANEHYGEIYSTGSVGRWNDLPNTSILGYVVEYGGMEGDPVLKLSSGRTVNIAAYSVTYNGNNNTGGTAPTDLTAYTFNAAASVRTNTGGLERYGYTFAGWNTLPDGNGIDYKADGTGTLYVTSDTTLYAKWIINQYTLTYTAGSNGSITGASAQTVNHGANGTEVVAVPSPGHHFVSWSDGELTANRTDTDVTGNINVTAVFAINQYTLTYVAGSNGSISGPSIQTINYGGDSSEVIAVPDEGYHFLSWSDGVMTANRTEVSVTGDITATATFAINQYDISFDSKGGSAVTALIAEHGSKIVKPDDPSKTGYSFAGWFKDEAFTAGWLFGADIVTENVTLYAKWVNYAPTGTLVINNGDDYTNNTTVLIEISATDPEADAVTQMSFSNDSINWSEWEAFSTTRSYILLPDDGLKTVHIKFMDINGNEGSSSNDSITLKTGVPVISGAADGGKYNTDVSPSFIEGTALLSKDGGAQVSFTSETVISDEGNYTLVLTDLAGNTATISFIIDKTAPEGSITINDGNAETHSDAAILSLTASDPGGSGIAEMRFSTDGTTWSAWEAFAATKAWTAEAYGTVTVYFQVKDNAGNISADTSDSIEYHAAPPVIPPSDPPVTPPATTEAPSENIDILVNGQTENIGTSSTDKEEGQTTVTITVNGKKLGEKLESAGNQATVTIPFNNQADSYVGELNGQMVKNMEDKQAIIEVRSPSSTYTLPAGEINIGEVSEQFGADISLEDIKVHIQISEPTPESVKIVENASKQGEFSVVVPPVEYSVSCTYQGRTAEVSSFNSYVERTIAIPDGIDPSKITTGVVIEPDGTIRHVPTMIVIIDGKYYAKINSLTNSTYTLVWNPVEYSDTDKHWSKEAVNDMASRMILTGNEQGLFNPDGAMTRGEFAAVMVRALGLKPGEGANPFSDVKDSDPNSDFIKTAYKYGILSGYGNGYFGLNDLITRQQGIAIVARAMQVTGVKLSLTREEVDGILAAIKDSDEIASYARNPVAACVKTGIVSGRRANYVAPAEYITRAEVAVLVRMLLQKSALI